MTAVIQQVQVVCMYIWTGASGRSL